MVVLDGGLGGHDILDLGWQQRDKVYNEEVVIFRSKPGAAVGAHCGSSNAVINLHLTLKGGVELCYSFTRCHEVSKQHATPSGRGTSISVDGIKADLHDGTAICFQDSYFHAVNHGLDGEEERISLVLRVMHPGLSLDLLSGVGRTDDVLWLKVSF